MTLEEIAILVQARSIHGVGRVTLARYCRKYSEPGVIVEKLQTDFNKRPKLSVRQSRREV